MSATNETGVGSGVLPAVLSPLNADLSPDHKLHVRHCRWLLTQGCDGLAIHGTTGEANSFSVAERIGTLQTLVEGGIDGKKIIAGTGCCSIPDSVDLTNAALEVGAAGALMLPPFYYKNPSDEGLFAAFSEVIQRVGNEALKIYLYHFPAMSQTPISANLIAMLCEHFPNTVAGVKDSSGDLEYSLELASRFPNLAIFPGNETHLLATLEKGCAGCISATANANPRGIRNIFDNCLSGDSSVHALQEQAFAIREMFGRHPLVSALKQYAAWSTGDNNWLRLLQCVALCLHVLQKCHSQEFHIRTYEYVFWPAKKKLNRIYSN